MRAIPPKPEPPSPTPVRNLVEHSCTALCEPTPALSRAALLEKHRFSNALIAIDTLRTAATIRVVLERVLLSGHRRQVRMLTPCTSPFPLIFTFIAVVQGVVCSSFCITNPSAQDKELRNELLVLCLMLLRAKSSRSHFLTSGLLLLLLKYSTAFECDAAGASHHTYGRQAGGLFFPRLCLPLTFLLHLPALCVADSARVSRTWSSSNCLG
jgi:hypothetical protein